MNFLIRKLYTDLINLILSFTEKMTFPSCLAKTYHMKKFHMFKKLRKRRFYCLCCVITERYALQNIQCVLVIYQKLLVETFVIYLRLKVSVKWSTQGERSVRCLVNLKIRNFEIKIHLLNMEIVFI